MGGLFTRKRARAGADAESAGRCGHDIMSSHDLVEVGAEGSLIGGEVLKPSAVVVAAFYGPRRPGSPSCPRALYRYWMAWGTSLKRTHRHLQASDYDRRAWLPLFSTIVTHLSSTSSQLKRPHLLN